MKKKKDPNGSDDNVARWIALIALLIQSIEFMLNHMK